MEHFFKSTKLILSFIFYYLNLAFQGFRTWFSKTLDEILSGTVVLDDNIEENGTRLIMNSAGAIEFQIVDYQKWFNSPAVKRQIEGVEKIRKFNEL